MADIKKMISKVAKDPKQMLVVIAVSVVAGLALYIAFVLSPQIAKISGLRSGLAKARAELKATEADIAKMDSMKAAVEAYNSKVGKYEKTPPTEEGIPALLESLAEMAKNSNMRIIAIVPIESKGEAPKGRTYKEIPIMISAKAGYHELGRFMSNLEASDRFIKIVDMQIKSTKATPKKHDVEQQVVTYVLLGVK